MIALVDSCKDTSGHNVIYLKELHSIENTEVVSLDIDNGEQNNVFAFLYNRYKNFKKQLSVANSARIIHFLHADLYYMVPFLKKFYNKERRVILTMHYFPTGRIRQKLLKNFCSKANKVIVHSSYIKSQYNNIGIRNVEYIDYPSFYDYSKIQNSRVLKIQMGLEEGDIVFSALGGTRFDKGLDILIDAFSMLSPDIKKRVVLNIAGRPLIFKEDFIKKKALGANFKMRLVLKELSEDEFLENVVVSNYIVLPYRKDFTGNSGPMTEAVVNRIPCIVSDHGNIGYLTKVFKIGRTFRSEEPNSLADVIKEEVLNSKDYDFSYANNLSKKSFIDKHKYLYNSVV
ncbi:glycosyltransferase [Plebeiibacterium marinum]|uniref:Glycosyltransferase n=1 Tax=Plebeiibacterium marinum TaxID=2992111 RepID=A0AAE3MA76_9BACT|nr:glycosyltransferase [Plebeiobacterium marinum]MCW3804141.1 glycosyltransferase [Plebeiobacterium marinum]